MIGRIITTMKYTKEYYDAIERVIKNVPNVEQLKNKSIVVTGATGLICSVVADLLMNLNDKGYGIKILLAGRDSERMKARFEDRRQFVNDISGNIKELYDFINYDATKGCQDSGIKADYVIHGASNADPARISGEPVETMLANIQGFSALINSLDRGYLKKVLYISSSEVYGINEKQEPYKEEQLGYLDILNTRNCYPSSKRAAETMCAAYSDEYGIETVIVRPSYIYGPTIKKSDSRASALFSTKAAKGENIVMKSKGEQLRSYTHVLDCASAILAVLINGENKQAYNISAPQSIVTIRQMAEAFAKAGNVDIIFDVPTEAETKSYNKIPCSALDSGKLEALGWKAEYDMESGAVQTVNMLRQRL